MSDFDFFFSLIPEKAYRYIVMALVGLLIFRQKIPILNRIDVRVRLPEEFMRHFRWLTPILILGLYFWMGMTYLVLKEVMIKLNLIVAKLGIPM